MEGGQWEEANSEKVRLEEKQRAVRRQKESEAEKAAAEGTLVGRCFRRLDGGCTATG
jgi:hypothetical protein